MRFQTLSARSQAIVIFLTIPAGLLIVATLDYVGPWYLPAILSLTAGGIAGLVPKCFRLVFPFLISWPLYSAGVIGLYMTWINSDYVHGLSRMFNLPQYWMLWLIPLTIYSVLSGLSFASGRSLTLAVRRYYER